MLLDEAQRTDLRVSASDVETAAQEAAEAEELLAALERKAVEGTEKPSRVIEQRALAEFARKRIEHTRGRAAAARAAKRLLDLAEVGAAIDALAKAAAQPDRSVAYAVRAVAEAAAQLRQLCAQHDEQVRALAARAIALGAEEPAPAGPRGTSAHVTVLPRRGVQHGRLQARLIGDTAGDAVALAAAGDVDAAVQLLAEVHELPEPHRSERYFRNGAGHVIGHDGQIPEGFKQMLREGSLVQLTDTQIDAYLEGTLDGQAAHRG